MGQPAKLALAPAAPAIITQGRESPLIQALFEQLPGPSLEFSSEQRIAWLEMMSHAFTIVYGGAVGGNMQTTKVPGAVRAAVAKKPAKPKGPAKQSKAALLEPDFYIDKDHYARKAGGERITIGEAEGKLLIDLRGEFGDLLKIIWADNSTGIQGKQLDIAAG